MATLPIFNGIQLRENEYLKDQKRSTLSMMLGKDGLPKYSESQMKSVTRAMMLAELTPLYEEALKALPAKEKKIGGKRGRKRGASSNKKSAQVKKCNMIRALSMGELSADEAKSWLNADPLLASLCTADEIDKASEGVRPGRGRRKNTNNDTTDEGYIIAKARGE